MGQCLRITCSITPSPGPCDGNFGLALLPVWETFKPSNSIIFSPSLMPGLGPERGKTQVVDFFDFFPLHLFFSFSFPPPA